MELKMIIEGYNEPSMKKGNSFEDYKPGTLILTGSFVGYRGRFPFQCGVIITKQDYEDKGGKYPITEENSDEYLYYEHPNGKIGVKYCEPWTDEKGQEKRIFPNILEKEESLEGLQKVMDEIHITKKFLKNLIEQELK